MCATPSPPDARSNHAVGNIYSPALLSREAQRVADATERRDLSRDDRRGVHRTFLSMLLLGVYSIYFVFFFRFFSPSCAFTQYLQKNKISISHILNPHYLRTGLGSSNLMVAQAGEKVNYLLVRPNTRSMRRMPLRSFRLSAASSAGVLEMMICDEGRAIVYSDILGLLA